jgi:pimeloyl-ACP methyl ester carboxylesterase
VEAVRAALGYEQWNLYGISYGTKLALEVMRQHPDGVRTVVIDSVFPAEVDSTRDNPQTFVASYRAVVAACAQEPACAAAGDLAQRFEAVVAAYDAEPLQVEIQDYVNGETIVGVVAQALYSPEQFSDLPELVGELEQARTDAVVAYLSQQRSNEPFFSSGMFYAFECNEEIPFADPAEVTAAMPPDPFGRKATFDYASNNGPAAFATCAAFDSRAGAAPPDPEANQAVVSDTPTLVMAGRFDPVTPVAWAEQAAANLAGSHLVVAPLGSHGISPGRCGMDVIRQFLDQPEQAPDASCFEGADLAFLSAPEAEEVVLEEVTFPSVDPSLTVTTVRPRDWVHTDLDGNSLRQRSFLDPTEIVQLAGDSTLAAGLASYLATSLDVELSPPMPVDRFERTWRYRTGRTASEAVEWYETEIDGHVTIVILISALAELEANVGAVLDPALDNISVSG